MGQKYDFTGSLLNIGKETNNLPLN